MSRFKATAHSTHEYESTVLMEPAHDNIFIPWYPSERPRQIWMYIFYLVAIAYTLGYFIIYTCVEHPHGPTLYDQTKPVKFGWHFVFFAYWNGILQVMFWILCLVDFYFRSNSKFSQRLHEVKDKFYDVLFALTLLVAISYWFTVFPNRSTQFKRLYEDVFSYGLPAVFVVFEMLIVSHRYATHTWHIIRDMLIPLTIYGAYVGFSYICHHENGTWAYKYQATLRPSLIAISYAAGGIGVMLLFTIGKMLSRCMWHDMPTSAEHDDDIPAPFTKLAHQYGATGSQPLATNLPPDARTTPMTLSSDYRGGMSGDFSGRFSYVDDELQHQHNKQREHIVRDYQSGMQRFI